MESQLNGQDRQLLRQLTREHTATLRRQTAELDRLLKEDAKAGRLDHDPAFRYRILRRGYNALHELALMGHDLQLPVGARTLARFKVADDLEIDQVLTEPLVRKPVFMNFDERGRLFRQGARSHT